MTQLTEETMVNMEWVLGIIEREGNTFEAARTLAALGKGYRPTSPGAYSPEIKGGDYGGCTESRC